MPNKSALKPAKKKSLAQHCDDVAAEVSSAISKQIDPEQVRAVLRADKVTMPESHPVTGRILSALKKRGLTPSAETQF